MGNICMYTLLMELSWVTTLMNRDISSLKKHKRAPTKFALVLTMIIKSM